MKFSEMGDWDCPKCGEGHSDPAIIKTHCRQCGLIVYTGEIDKHGVLDRFTKGEYIDFELLERPLS